MKFWEMLKNDARGQESKNKEIATLEERIRYTEYMALICGTAGLTFMAAGGWFVGLGFGLWLVAARKIWIVLDKKDFF